MSVVILLPLWSLLNVTLIIPLQGMISENYFNQGTVCSFILFSPQLMNIPTIKYVVPIRKRGLKCQYFQQNIWAAELLKIFQQVF